MFRFASLLAGAASVLAFSAPSIAAEASPKAVSIPAYPETRRDEIVETIFGEKIADPYRWLEGDVRNTPEVADWVARENAVTQACPAGNGSSRRSPR